MPPSPISVTGTLAADAVGRQVTAADNAAHAHSAGNSHCLNCGTKLAGPFCSACGQHDFDFHRSFRHVFMEALENIFHFDGKFFRNLVTLLFRPGRLTGEFNAGRRASQVPPFRLYIFTAFVFFLLLMATSDRRPPAVQMGPGTGASLTLDGKPVLAKKTAAENPPDAPAQPEKDASAAPATRAGTRSELEQWAAAQGRRAMDPQFQSEMGRRFVAALPKMMLFCVPAFALCTRFLFRKSGQVYLQHLVLALHFHTFIFIFVLFRDGWAYVAEWVGLSSVRGMMLFAGNTWLAVYPVLMLRHLFANSWPRTLGKTLALALAYGLVLALAFTVTAAVLFLMM